MYASNNFQNIIFLDFLKKNGKKSKKVSFFFIKICVRLQQFSDFFPNLCTLPTFFKILFFWIFRKMPKKTFRKIWVRLQHFFQKFRAKNGIRVRLQVFGISGHQGGHFRAPWCPDSVHGYVSNFKNVLFFARNFKNDTFFIFFTLLLYFFTIYIINIIILLVK